MDPRYDTVLDLVVSAWDVLLAHMARLRFAVALLGLAAGAVSSPAGATGAAAWPNAPLVTSGRWIHDAAGRNVTFAGANWPGATDVMIPEGLQYQSVQTIVSKIKSIGMNTVRLTYAIQMIDEIYANGGKDVSLQTAVVQALGAANGAKILAQILAKNPTFTAQTTRLQVGPGERRGPARRALPEWREGLEEGGRPKEGD